MSIQKSPITAVLGYSPKADRYSFKAFHRLREHGHQAIPIRPAGGDADGVPVARDLVEAKNQAGDAGISTLTLYVRPSLLEAMVEEILAAQPGRVIFNPGTESAPLQHALDQAGIPWMEACTLVLLSTGQYD
ncbi:MAG: CoA-binding protein [Spirochaetales bacterium]|nr:CoA-binding protein [Spirochaetales bacterium]